MKKLSNQFLILLVVFFLFPVIMSTPARAGEPADEAIAHYKAMVKENPESIKAQSGLAKAYINKYISTGKTEKLLLLRAKRAIKKAEKIDDKSALPQISWAKYSMARGKKEAAIKRAKKAAALDPENSEVQKLLEELGVKVAGKQTTDKIQEIIYSDGSKYIGSVVNGKKHGQGTLVWADGAKYAGTWVKGKRTGKGIYTGADGRVRDGLWKEDTFVPEEKKPAPPAESRQAKASIKTIKVEHDVLQNNKKGMRIHIKVTVKGLKGRKSRISAYFYYKDGSKLKDLDGKLKSASGQVSVGKKITPPYESTRWDDFKLFIPYDQLHLKKGMQKLKFNIIVWNLSGSSSVKLAESEWVKFKYEERGIRSLISKVWVEYDVYQNKKKGMKIHAILVVKGLKRKKVAISGYFYYKSGKKLKDHDGKYKTNDGQIAVSKKVNPKHDSSRWDDLSLFMPYDQLHLGKGKHDLKFYLLVWDKSGRTSIKLTQSEWYYFQITT